MGCPSLTENAMALASSACQDKPEQQGVQIGSSSTAARQEALGKARAAPLSGADVPMPRFLCLQTGTCD